MPVLAGTHCSECYELVFEFLFEHLFENHISIFTGAKIEI